MVINGDYTIDIVVDGDKGLTLLGNNVDINNLLHGDFSNGTEVNSTIDILEVLNGEYGSFQRVTSYDTYKGETNIIPTQEVQVLQTLGKGMEDNIIIQPIPNNYGKITYNGAYLKVE